jgi:hypothetical protein
MKRPSKTFMYFVLVVEILHLIFKARRTWRKFNERKI